MNWRQLWRKRLIGIHQFRRLPRGLKKAQLVRTAALGLLLVVIAGSLLTALLFAWYARDLPSPDKVVRREGFATKILDREGNLLYDVFSQEQRTSIEFKDLPEYLKQATVAIEDQNFYKHGGFDPKGLTRAFLTIAFRGQLAGGSTLTQQLVKNVLLSSERTLPRKIKEFILAVQIERRYNKDQILQMYLNEAPYGGTAWGVATAAETYFGKKVNDLTLLESAILAGMPQRPSVYSPYGPYPDAYIDRTKHVLRRMREDGYLTKEQEEAVGKELADVEFLPQSVGIKAPHFVMYVKEKLIDIYGDRLVEQGGLKVTTTLDFDLQEKAQTIVSEEIEKVKNQDIGNGAAVVMDPNNGEVLAMVGSKDFFAKDYDGQVNVTTSLRQPGSAIKPVTYVTAFKQGYTPATMLVDAATEFPGGFGQPAYAPANYDGKFRGPVQLRFALGSSLNLPSVKLLALVGVKNMLQTAFDLGFTSLEPTTENLSRFGLAVTLGGGEVRLLDMVTAYSAFANSGHKIEPVSILKVEDQDGKTLYEQKSIEGRRVLEESETFLINHILSDNNARLLTFGPNSYLNMGNEIAVKTGTTNDKRDNWTVGWNRRGIVGVWVGNNDNSPMKEVASGVTGASPIWRRIMTEVIKDHASEPWPIPGNIKAVLVDSVSGYPEHHGFVARTEYIIDGTLPSLPDPIHAMLKLCKSSGKLATEVDIAKGDYDEKEFVVLQEKDPFNQEVNKWQSGIDAWLAGYSDPKYQPPREQCDSKKDIAIRFKKPEDHQNFDGNDIPVEIDVIAEGDIDKVDFLVDGSVHLSFTGSRISETTNLGTGRHTVRVRVTMKDGRNAESEEHRIGVGGVTWEEPTPAPSPTP
ncbi:hypothetical protein A3A66_02145 [Microgenomates group bacterium RIFCSPLOWO2_01_FULL_46_13]|nr:MAG: hypothetical protein A2783_01915 [Microgenomates group bacterium RIFCSPHIGHO2_01_FULL_45_11]OGV94777.1 MAG: hypothetical protein A3A66_02145 [Microgenomates group bacterium RIFCSPLOWO2_01_FULL_46_13]